MTESTYNVGAENPTERTNRHTIDGVRLQGAPREGIDWEAVRREVGE